MQYEEWKGTPHMKETESDTRGSALLELFFKSVNETTLQATIDVLNSKIEDISTDSPLRKALPWLQNDALRILMIKAGKEGVIPKEAVPACIEAVQHAQTNFCWPEGVPFFDGCQPDHPESSYSQALKALKALLD